MLDDHTGATMHIGELAERSGLSLRTIRHYGDIGLLPASARTEAGYRVFSEQDLHRLLRIKHLKPLGFSLEEIAEALPIFDTAEGTSRNGRIAEVLTRLESERDRLALHVDQADELIAELRDQLR